MPLAVVTGGARRVGKAIAEHLHAKGFDIALHYRGSRAEAEALATRLNTQRSDSCSLFQGDFASDAAAAALAAEMAAAHPRIDLLVNNASGFEPTPLSSCTSGQFEAMFNSNLRGPYFLVQGLLPALRAAAGSIVNIVDVHIERPLVDFNVYGAAKAGLASLTRSLAVELGPDIRVNAVAPGAIIWPENDAAYDAEVREQTIAQTPLKRLGEPLDIARTVAFLAVDAPFITGQVITVDGGRSLV